MAKKMTALEKYRENAAQLNEAKKAAQKIGALHFQFTDVDGNKSMWHWQGGSYDRRRNSMAMAFSGKKWHNVIYKAAYKNRTSGSGGG